MHARPDNPELRKAQMLNLKVYSYPQYLYEQTKHKKRIVIAGSHGKTTITSMLLHTLRRQGRKFDFMVGAQIKGFDTMVELSDDADIAVFEGDEYLSSPIDRRPKFLWYKPHIALITGIAWDHINVFPTMEEYNRQFELFADTIEREGTLIYHRHDPVLAQITQNRPSISVVPYDEVPSRTQGGKTTLEVAGKAFDLKVFGRHNMQNIAGALEVAERIDISKTEFFDAMQSFEGAARRLQVLGHNDKATIFYDFAHAPSKVKATVDAVKDQFPQRQLTAVIELHTFSSLNRDFLPQYRGVLERADEAIVFFNPQVVAHKKLPEITTQDVANAFDYTGLEIFTNPVKLEQHLSNVKLSNANLLLMSSGNIAGIDLQVLTKKMLE
jgi:UDP-N-acetylmuramate: L-alanyl-gamma-D-glutamyl-meso-diaminopimelate ligase